MVALLAIAVIFLAGIDLGTKTAPSYAGVGGDGINLFFAVGTTSTETVGTSDVTVLATSTARTWALISNNSGNALLCNYGAPVTGMGGFVIAASSTKQLDSNALFTGAIHCVAQAGNSSIFVMANQNQ